VYPPGREAYRSESVVKSLGIREVGGTNSSGFADPDSDPASLAG
jgi:hypothetical protein